MSEEIKMTIMGRREGERGGRRNAGVSLYSRKTSLGPEQVMA